VTASPEMDFGPAPELTRGSGELADTPNGEIWNGRYQLPHPETGKPTAWTRATTLAKTLDDETFLTKWKMRGVARGVAIRSDLRAMAAACPFDAEHRDDLDEIAESALEAAGGTEGRTLGSAYHKFAQRLGAGAITLDDVPEDWREDLAAYQDLLTGNGLRVVPAFIERKGINLPIGAAGTFDNLLATHTGELIVADEKTAKKLSYGLLGISAQLAIYADITHLWNEAAQWYDPMPQVNRDIALVIHTPVGDKPELREIPLDEGREIYQLAAAVREKRNKAKRVAFSPRYTPPLHVRVRHAPTVEALKMLYNYNAPAWTDELTSLGMQRVAELQAKG
jgi:hypothetical protein